MKTKFYWVALLASAALIAQAQAGGHQGGGRGFSGGGFRGGHTAGGSVRSFHSMPMRNFGGGRMMHSGQRFSSAGRYSPSSAAFRQHSINSNRGASLRAPQFNRENINRADRLPRFSSGANRAIANPRREGNGAAQGRSGNRLATNWQSHVVAQHSGNWHRDWDRSRDHRWHGHHSLFINGSWFIFDSGFYPGSYWYPDDYYASDYYGSPYGYDPGYDETGVYDETGSAGQSNDSTVAAAQERLARQGYYRGKIDGIVGPETRRAIMRYQSDHGLRVTGRPDVDTLRALELPRLGSN
jgi:hypothetical protein